MALSADGKMAKLRGKRSMFNAFHGCFFPNDNFVHLVTRDGRGFVVADLQSSQHPRQAG